VETDDMWSPDGRYLAYRYSGCGSSRDDGPKGVVISDAKGNVFAKFPTGLGWQIRWSPNSDRVAVWDDYGKTIGIYGPGGRQTQLTMPPPGGAGGDIDPFWTPDGTSVLVFGDAGMIELPLDRGAPRPYRSYWDKDNPPVSSPDGSQIAYLERRSVMIANADGSNPRELLGHGVGNPVWSPTGDRIAVATAGHGNGSPIELQVIDVATGSATLVTKAEPGSGLDVVGFTPNGNRIFFSTGSDGSWSGWSIGVDGSDARLILDGTLDASFARFLVDKVGDNFYRAPWSPETGRG
jgi:Tol biopolymer transport system component